MLKINDLSAKISRHKFHVKAAVERVIASGWFVLGPEVDRFERSFAEYLGAAYCVSLGNGTDAIELALRSMGVNSGDFVATVANAGMYTTTALLAIGAAPRFMDVSLETRGATLAEVTRAIESGVKAVVVTHLYGLAIPEILQISQYCRQKGVPLLEDCAQAHGAQIDGKQIGTFGDAASFSFYPTKNLGAIGDGGAVVTSSQEIADRVRSLRQYGWAGKYRVEVMGARNSRLDEIQAAILSEFLPELDAENVRRREIAAQYSTKIVNSNVVLPPKGGADYVAHLYVIRSKFREALRDHLREIDIGSDVHYPIPDYRQPVFSDRFVGMKLGNTERLACEILTLPCFPEMTDAEVARVIAGVNGWRV